MLTCASQLASLLCPQCLNILGNAPYQSGRAAEAQEERARQGFPQGVSTAQTILVGWVCICKSTSQIFLVRL